MTTWYDPYTTVEFRKVLETHFEKKFAWRFDDKEYVFAEVADRLVYGILPNAKIRHLTNTRAYVLRCFDNAVRDRGDGLYTNEPVPEELESLGKRYKRLFWEYCLHGLSKREIAGYCEISESEVRFWVTWIVRKKKCPKPSARKPAKVVDPESREVMEKQQDSFAEPDDAYFLAQRQRLLLLWCEETPEADGLDLDALERRLRALPRPKLSVLEKRVLRCRLKEMSVAETAEALGMYGKEQQIRNARTSLKTRLKQFCIDNDLQSYL